MLSWWSLLAGNGKSASLSRQWSSFLFLVFVGFFYDEIGDGFWVYWPSLGFSFPSSSANNLFYSSQSQIAAALFSFPLLLSTKVRLLVTHPLSFVFLCVCVH